MTRLAVPAETRMGAPNAEIDHGQVVRGGEGSVFRRLASVGHHHRWVDVSEGLSQPRHHSGIDPGAAPEALRDTQLAVGPKNDRGSGKEGEDQVVVVWGVETIDERTGVALSTPIKIIREDMDHRTAFLLHWDRGRLPTPTVALSR